MEGYLFFQVNLFIREISLSVVSRFDIFDNVFRQDNINFSFKFRLIVFLFIYLRTYKISIIFK